MLKKLIIFNTPPDFSHPLLTRIIRGSGLLIATLPDNQITKLKASLDFDMICLEDIDKPLEDCLRLRKINEIDWKFNHKLRLIDNSKDASQIQDVSNHESNEHINFLHEKFVINTESTSQIMMNSFISPQILKIFQGNIMMSNKSKFIIHNNLIYTHYLDEIFTWGQLEKGKYYFSNDDKYLVVRKSNCTILYFLDTMETKIYPTSNRIVFGKDILLLDHFLIELKENIKNIYKPIIEESKNQESLVDDWVDSNEEENVKEENCLLKQFDDIWFSPTKYEFITTIDDKLTLYRYEPSENTSDKAYTNDTSENFYSDKPEPQESELLEQNINSHDIAEKNENENKLIFKPAEAAIVRTNISSDMIKEVSFVNNRCFAIIAKYINNRLKYFIESYCGYVTVTELTDNMDLTFRFSEESFLIGFGTKLEYYKLKNKRFVLVNTVEDVCSNLIDLKDDFYCCISLNDEILFYKNKELIRKQSQSDNNVTFNNINSIQFTTSGLFITIFNQIQLTLFDCNGNFIWNKIFGDLKAVNFFDEPKISETQKKKLKQLAYVDEEVFFDTFLGNKKNQNVHCFKKQEKTLEEKRKIWLKFLCAL